MKERRFRPMHAAPDTLKPGSVLYTYCVQSQPVPSYYQSTPELTLYTKILNSFSRLPTNFWISGFLQWLSQLYYTVGLAAAAASCLREAGCLSTPDACACRGKLRTALLHSVACTYTYMYSGAT